MAENRKNFYEFISLLSISLFYNSNELTTIAGTTGIRATVFMMVSFDGAPLKIGANTY